MKKIVLIPLLLLLFLSSFPQKKEDSLLMKSGTVITPLKKDTSIQPQGRSPKTAAIRSAILPGWGQAYNKKYWKIPLAWAAVGIPAFLYADNKKWYKRCQYALAVVNSNTTNADSLNRVYPQLKPLVESKAANSLQTYRNQFRQNQDYSALFFILLWGLNVVDAAVDAHLSTFNVNSDLSLKIEPSLQPGMAGLSLVLAFK